MGKRLLTRISYVILMITFLVGFGGCTIPAVKQAPVLKPINLQPDEKAKPILFKKIVVRIPRGKCIGKLYGGVFCIPAGDITWRSGQGVLPEHEYSEVFREEFEKANYEVVGDPDALFDDPSTWKAELLIGGIIKDIQANVCFTLSGFGDFSTAKGDVFISVDWQIYHRLVRKVVYETSTEGSHCLVETTPTGADDLFVEAFAEATRNLLADNKLHDLVSKQTTIPPKPSFESLIIKRSNPYKNPISKQITDVRLAVVTVFAGDGHGSGFYITSDGYLLTNAHVVETAKFVKIKFATGRELLGEVLRTDNVRDVALIKTEECDIEPLPIQTADLNVGDEVYCMGSPIDDKFQTTTSKGICSGYYFDEGIKFIQSDVNVLPGSSGGPLLDFQGNIVGMTFGGITLSGAPSGLNFFIPIGEALDRLSIKLESE